MRNPHKTEKSPTAWVEKGISKEKSAGFDSTMDLHEAYRNCINKALKSLEQDDDSDEEEGAMDLG